MQTQRLYFITRWVHFKMIVTMYYGCALLYDVHVLHVVITCYRLLHTINVQNCDSISGGVF